MSIQDLVNRSAHVSVTVGLDDLIAWHKEVVADTRRELEEVVLSDKAETYPTVKQAQEILNVDPSTLWRWNKTGYLKHIEFGGGRRYRMSDIKAILNGGK